MAKSDLDITREQIREKYQIEKVERHTGFRDGYRIYFKDADLIPDTEEEQFHICFLLTEYLFGYEIAVDKEKKIMYYWGYTR